MFNYDDAKKVFHINGLSFSKQTGLDRPTLGSAGEWTLIVDNATGAAADEPHLFHIHVNPFQVVQVEDVQTKRITRVDEWRDTIAVETGQKIWIDRFQSQFTARLVGYFAV